MAEFLPVIEVRDLVGIDEVEVGFGYAAGLSGDPEPVASTFSRSYWLGWRSGIVVAEHREWDAAQRIALHNYHLSHSATARAAGYGEHFPLQ